MSQLPQQLADAISTYTKTVIVLLLLVTVAMGAGVPMVEQQSDTQQFETDSPAVTAQEYIQANFTTETTTNETIMQLIQRADEGENVLTKESLIASLEFQKKLLETDSVSQTFTAENPLFGVPNVLGNAALQAQAQPPAEQPPGTEPPEDEPGAEPPQDDHIANINAQIDALDALSDEELEELIASTLGEDAAPGILSLLPQSYEPGSPHAEAMAIVITQDFTVQEFGDPTAVDERLTSSQLEIRDLALEEEMQYSVFGFGIITDEIDRSLGDSFALVGPLALLFVVLALSIAYRDLFDILLGVFGIIVVLVWTFGFMGWFDISFNQLLISVPVLLIGLSIDYAIHVFMRHRERRIEEDSTRDLRRSMALALGGVGVALVWVTATAAIGFLANLISPIGPLQDFAVTAAFGIVAALLVFGVLIPALKIELDSLLERVGLNRQKRAFGTGDSIFGTLLSSGAVAARRFPVAIVVAALVLTAGGVYGATQVDTTFQEEDFLADEPPAWTQQLPEQIRPGTYQAKADIEYIQANFQPAGSQADFLVRGDVTDDQALQWMAESEDILGEKETVYRLPTDEPDVQTPLSMMQRTVASYESGDPVGDEEATAAFVEAFTAATDEDGIPRENIEELYDKLLEANPAASELLYRTPDGEYEALRVVVEIRGDADTNVAASELRAAAEELEAASGGQLVVQATGDQVIFDNVESDLLDTVIQGLLITLVAVFLFMALAYRMTGNPASLGIVTLIPVLLAVAWILGSMWLLDIPFNTLTGTITSLTIGLGIAYSIHISARYELELRRQGDVWDAMQTTVTGTGGALLGSAATTVGGFGTLAFAILPVLQQFGIITGLTIIYAFLASVLVLPSMLVLWTRYFGPSGYFPPHDDETEEPVATAEQPTADGGETKSH